MSQPNKESLRTGAQLLVECLKAQGVQYIFGVPGASIMPILDVLRDRGPEFIVCRHEQNAAFMAQAIGRLTGRPGVCLATMGPGATNLVTGVATATADRDPLLALTGQVARGERFKIRHQNIDAAQLFAPITKWSVELEDVSGIPEAVAQAWRTAVIPRPGATHLALPLDILTASTKARPLTLMPHEELGEADAHELTKAARLLLQAKQPMMLIGVGASDARSSQAVRQFLAATGIPAAVTFQAAGVVGRALLDQFLGRVGLAAEEPGDIALRDADVVLTVGYDVIEYAPSMWTTNATIIHLDRLVPTVDRDYKPQAELIGEIAAILGQLQKHLKGRHFTMTKKAQEARDIVPQEQRHGAKLKGKTIHPLRLIAELRKVLSDTDLLISDVGAHQVWLAREFFTYEPRTLLFSMGFQTMGVALPWAIAARLVKSKGHIVSCSGDGSFLMSVMELETAVRRKLPLVHLVWRDGTYNLVEIQQRLAYGRVSGTKFGNPDIVALAKSFGATGLRINNSRAIVPTLERALRIKGPVIVDIPIDYRYNTGLLDKGSLFEG